MADVLVIRKTDKTIHKVPVANQAALKSYSNRLPIGQRWEFEIMDEEDAKKLPFVDQSYVTQGEAQNLVKDLDAQNQKKDAKIKELEEKLAALSNTSNTPTKATDLIAQINAATTADEVNDLVGEDETRKTVLDARDTKLATFQ